MFRASPLRLVGLLILFATGLWVALAALYAFLPFTPYGWDLEPSQHLSTGAKVTRVYNTDEWFFWNEPSHAPVREAWRECFVLEYQLEYAPTMKTSRLHLGPSVSIDLHDHWSRVDASKPAQVAEDLPSYVSDPIQVNVKIGEFDGISLPWFRKADATLLFHEIHKSNVSIPLRLQVYKDKMQLWPDSELWDEMGRPPHRVGKPLLELYNTDQFNGTNIESMMPENYDQEPMSWSPSQTFAIRRTIQAILVPTGLWVYHHTQFSGVILAVVVTAISIVFQLLSFVAQICVYYTIVIIICWILSGRPRFGPWAQSFVLTRMLFGKYQSVMQQRWPAYEEHNYESSDGDRRPHPLRGPLDFFRSRNPMDDLLVTFDCTKRFLEPISFRKSTPALGELGQVSMPNEIKLDVSHRIRRPDRAQRKGKEWEDLEKGAP